MLSDIFSAAHYAKCEDLIDRYLQDIARNSEISCLNFDSEDQRKVTVTDILFLENAKEACHVLIELSSITQKSIESFSKSIFQLRNLQEKSLTLPFPSKNFIMEAAIICNLISVGFIINFLKYDHSTIVHNEIIVCIGKFWNHVSAHKFQFFSCIDSCFDMLNKIWKDLNEEERSILSVVNILYNFYLFIYKNDEIKFSIHLFSNTEQLFDIPLLIISPLMNNIGLNDLQRILFLYLGYVNAIEKNSFDSWMQCWRLYGTIKETQVEKHLLYFYALSLYNFKNYDYCLQYVNSLLQKNDFLDTWFTAICHVLIARCLFHQQKYYLALQRCRMALQLDVNCLLGLLHASDIYKCLGLHSAQLKSLELANEIIKKKANIYLWDAHMFFLNIFDPQLYVEKNILQHKLAFCYLQQELFHKAVEVYSSLINECNSSKMLCEASLSYLMHQQYSQVISLCEQLSESDSLYPLACILKGKAHSLEGNFQESLNFRAISAVQNCLQKNSEEKQENYLLNLLAFGFYEKGCALWRLEDKNCLSAFETAWAYNPKIVVYALSVVNTLHHFGYEMEAQKRWNLYRLADRSDSLLKNSTIFENLCVEYLLNIALAEVKDQIDMWDSKIV